MKNFRSVGSNYPGLYLLGLTTQVAYNVTSLLFALGIGTYRQLKPKPHSNVLASPCILYLEHASPVLDRSTTEYLGL